VHPARMAKKPRARGILPAAARESTRWRTRGLTGLTEATPECLGARATHTAAALLRARRSCVQNVVAFSYGVLERPVDITVCGSDKAVGARCAAGRAARVERWRLDERWRPEAPSRDCGRNAHAAHRGDGGRAGSTAVLTPQRPWPRPAACPPPQPHRSLQAAACSFAVFRNMPVIWRVAAALCAVCQCVVF